MSPGGVGFDINCGVRLLRTNVTEEQVQPVKEQLAQVRVDGRGRGGAGSILQVVSSSCTQACACRGAAAFVCGQQGVLACRMW